MQQAEIGLRLDRIAAQLTAIGESQIGRSVPAEQVAEALQTIASNASRIAEGQAQASEARLQILEIVTWIRDRMSGPALQTQFDDQQFVTKQLIGIMQGTRDDVILLRADFRRLAALVEQTLRLRAEDDDGWDGIERRLADRRRASF